MTPVPSSEAEAEAEPLISSGSMDVSALESLVGNDPVVLLEFLAEFRTGAIRIVQDLQAACTQGRAFEAGEQAHKLQSSARTVGAHALADLCADMASAGRAGRTKTLNELLPLFVHEFDAVNALVDERCTTGTSGNA